MHFADELIKKIKTTSPICVGLDPRYEQIPMHIQQDAPTPGAAFFEFNKGIIDAVHDIVPIVKPQVAFYEMLGLDGLAALSRTIQYAQDKGLMVLLDAKRNDIGSTAEAYANAYLDTEGDFVSDALTVTPYLGLDGIKPFVDKCDKNGKGLFILCKTSNPSSGDIQDQKVIEKDLNLYELMGQLIDTWGADLIGKEGYTSIGAVVGATYPDQAKQLRKLMPNSIFLVPGYGAQGGGAADVKPCFNKDGFGAIVNSSRGIIFAYEKSSAHTSEQYGDAAREAVVKMKEDLESVL
ncbi:MAG: orotidine-5'-phosphate decarboxylase [Candidatus Gracilibacteria bacterium]|nr:orotidine-5'-phosphate decarboxylase [Candidatus Gracilibacteria bacterium]